MSLHEQQQATKTHKADCQRHLPNTYIKGATEEEKFVLVDAFKEATENQDFSNVSYVRNPADMEAHLVALSKGFGTGMTVYGKGFGNVEWTAFVQSCCADEWIPYIQRHEKGVRMDAQTKAAKIAFWLCPFVIRCLQVVFWKKQNVLRDAMFVTWTCQETIGTAYARTVTDIKLTERWTFLFSANANGWSCVDIAAVHQAILLACETKKEDLPSTFLDQNWDAFAKFDGEGTHYRKWKEHRLEHEVTTFSGKKVHDVQILEAEVFNPQNPSNKSPRVIEIRDRVIMAHLKGIKTKLVNGQGSRYVGDGDMANPTEEMIAVFKGTWLNQNMNESIFGGHKYIHSLFNNISNKASAAQALVQKNHLFSDGGTNYTASRKRKIVDGARPAKRARKTEGRIAELPAKIVDSMLNWPAKIRTPRKRKPRPSSETYSRKNQKNAKKRKRNLRKSK